jgi:hypothetical protein
MKKYILTCLTPCYKVDYKACVFSEIHCPPTQAELKNGYDYCILGYGDGGDVHIVYEEVG